MMAGGLPAVYRIQITLRFKVRFWWALGKPMYERLPVWRILEVCLKNGDILFSLNSLFFLKQYLFS
jgi:hypothetical protein